MRSRRIAVNYVLSGERLPASKDQAMRTLKHDECGLATTLNAIGGKWKTTILWEVNLAPRRFGELRRLLSGISEKVLAQQLREMEADALIRREIFPGAVQKVVYSVTPHGVSLNEAIGILSQWGKMHERHLEHVTARRA
ncbi:winged helix-turn-helix transcriptional regulator [Luteimonas salinilitoris]|uniref:Winged helix-turn-helix transcriptional regulator n=1 Tax=Luteimonas salinilitoris TaxID=3237697 RepID=A0ABV4HXE6_9GAMM